MIATVFAALFSMLSVPVPGDWAPAGDNIRTRWAEEVTPSNVHTEYPRPQMVRKDWQNLNGLWDYSIQPAVEENFSRQGKILVPFAVESSLSGVGKQIAKDEALWYERTFRIPKSWKNKRILLHFDAVDWKCETYLNGKHIGTHTGGYVPFTYDVTDVLGKQGFQTLTLKVQDASDNSLQARGKQSYNPAGIWYTPVSGVWQTVWIEAVPDSYIGSYYAIGNIKDKTIKVDVDAMHLKEGDSVRVELLEGGAGYDTEAPSANVIASKIGSAVEFSLDDINLWSVDNPYLYGLRIAILRNGKEIDSVSGYTAVRKISAKRDKDGFKRIALNDECLFQFGPLDQGWWPDGLYTAPTDEALRYDILKTKDWGFNMIRKHVKVEPARWYYYCDQAGLLVWQDMPNIGARRNNEVAKRDPEMAEAQKNRWVGDSFAGGNDCNIPEEWKENYYKEWGDILDFLKGFQCIAVWVTFNEAWGQFETRKAVEFTKKKDPSRLVNPASGGNYAICGDILDMHHYPHPKMNVYENTMVNVIGEYGGLGLPVEGHLWQKDQNWGYGGVKASSEKVISLYEQFAGRLKTYISVGCFAAVYTQTTDVEGEVNGIMTYDRKVIKFDEKRLRDTNVSVIESMSR